MNKTWHILSIKDLKVLSEFDFVQTAETVRKNLAKTKFVGDCLNEAYNESHLGLTIDEAKTIMATPEWSEPETI